jgi:hypothetical protein
MARGLGSATLHSKSAFQSHSTFLLSNRKGKCIPNLTERHSAGYAGIFGGNWVPDLSANRKRLEGIMGSAQGADK